MRCPDCSCHKTNVVDSRPRDSWRSTFRRRRCPKCGCRFNTHETRSENADASIRNAIIEDVATVVMKLNDLNTEDAQITSDGPYTKGDMWEMFYSGAHYFSDAAVKAIRAMKRED